MKILQVLISNIVNKKVSIPEIEDQLEKIKAIVFQRYQGDVARGRDFRQCLQDINKVEYKGQPGKAHDFQYILECVLKKRHNSLNINLMEALVAANYDNDFILDNTNLFATLDDNSYGNIYDTAVHFNNIELIEKAKSKSIAYIQHPKKSVVKKCIIKDNVKLFKLFEDNQDFQQIVVEVLKNNSTNIFVYLTKNRKIETYEVLKVLQREEGINKYFYNPMTAPDLIILSALARDYQLPVLVEARIAEKIIKNTVKILINTKNTTKFIETLEVFDLEDIFTRSVLLQSVARLLKESYNMSTSKEKILIEKISTLPPQQQLLVNINEKTCYCLLYQQLLSHKLISTRAELLLDNKMVKNMSELPSNLIIQRDTSQCREGYLTLLPLNSIQVENRLASDKEFLEDKTLVLWEQRLLEHNITQSEVPQKRFKI